MRGCAKRWDEQVRRVVEEMCRVAVSHSKTSAKWIQRAEEVESWTKAGPHPSWATKFAKGVGAGGGYNPQSTASIRNRHATSSSDTATDRPSPTKPSLAPDIVRGLRAYAYRQSHTWHMLGVACVRLWAPFLNKCQKSIVWPETMRREATSAVTRAEEEDRLKAMKAKEAGELNAKAAGSTSGPVDTAASTLRKCHIDGIVISLNIVVGDDASAIKDKQYAGVVEVDMDEAVVGVEGVDDWREDDPEFELPEALTDDEGDDWEDD